MWANATLGKPLTFEVRAIPNTLALNTTYLRAIVREVHKALNTKGSETLNIKSKIITEWITLCRLYKEMRSVKIK